MRSAIRTASLVTFVLAAFSALCVSACKKTTSLEGHWHGQRVDGQTQALKPAYQALTQFAADLDLTVKGTMLTVQMPGKTSSAEFTVQQEKDKTIVIAVAGGDAETFTFIGPTAMRWVVAEGTFIVFQKQAQ